MYESRKRVVITGAASGLGEALALGYAADGWRVAVTDLDQAACERTAERVAAAGGTPLPLVCDVRQAGDLRQLAARLEQDWEGVDVVINNAGVAGGGPFVDVPLEDWDWLLDINLMGVVRGCHAFAPMMIRQGGGHLVNVASMAGLLAPPGMAHYNVSKAGVVALSESLRAELDAHGIAVSVACPSYFRTNLLDSFRGPDERPRKIVEKFFASGKLTAEQVAAHIREGVAAGRFLLLPHPDGRTAWRIKRFLPPLYFREMRRFGKRLAGQARPSGDA